MNITSLKENIKNREVLKYLGFEIDSESDGHLRGICPIHKGDNKSAFIFKEETMLWYCHTHCKRGGDIINLIMEVKGFSFKEAVEKACEISGIEVSELKIDKKTKDKYENFEIWLKEIKNQKEALEEYNIETEKEEELISYKQFGEELCKFFDLKYAERVKLGEKWVYKKIIFPIKQNKKTIGATLRSTNKEDTVKWVNIPQGLKKNEILYNIDNIEKFKPVIIVEGPGDVLAVHNAGLTNVVSTMGSTTSEEQLELLLPITTELIYMYDGDKAGQLGMDASIKKAKKYFDCYKCILKQDEDPGGLNSEQIIGYYGSRKRG